MKILCLQLRQMGDVIMTTPAVRQLRALYPNAEIIFMTEPLGSNVYRNNPHISRQWVVPRQQSIGAFLKLLWQVRKERFDLVIDFFSNPKSAQIVCASRAKKRIGFNFKGRRYAYTLAVTPAAGDYAARSKNALIVPLGGNLDDVRTDFEITAESRSAGLEFARVLHFGTDTLAFCVVSRREYKLLEPAFFAAVGNVLIEAGYKLFFVYGPGEKPMAAAVFNLLEKPDRAMIDYVMPDLQTLRAILEQCRLYVGNDGGNKHLSVCAGIPTVTVFNEVRAENWTPPGHIAFQAENGVTPGEVVSACLEQLKGHP